MSLQGRSVPGPAPTSAVRPPPRRLPSLTGLRFPAALAVFAYHATLPIPALRLLDDDATAYAAFGVAGQAGALGVTFFFVLSGFVLTWSARPGDTARSFWRRRFVKIVPNYVVAWVLAMALIAGTTPAGTALLNLLMLQVWVPDFDVNFSVNPPSWSLGVEAAFYLAFPLLIGAVRRIRPDRLTAWIGLVVIGIVLTPLVAHLLLPGPSAAPALPGAESVSTIQYWFVYVLPPARVLDFVLGILVARTVLAGRWRDIGMRWSAALLAVAYVVAGFVPHLYGQRAVCVVPVALLIAAVAIADSRGRPTPFRSPVMVWLGQVSFAFYLLHFVVLATMRRVLGDALYPMPVTAALWVVAAGITLTAGWGLYALVERPLTRRWSGRPPARVPGASDGS